jgi:hypothetical protein
MLKVAILLPSLARTGPIFVAHKIVENLKDEVDFTVFYLDKIEHLPFSCKTVKISFFEKINHLNKLFYYYSIKKLLY